MRMLGQCRGLCQPTDVGSMLMSLHQPREADGVGEVGGRVKLGWRRGDWGWGRVGHWAVRVSEGVNLAIGLQVTY